MSELQLNPFLQPQAKGKNKFNKFLVMRASITMTDHMNLGSILNSGQPLRQGGKVGTEINKDSKGHEGSYNTNKTWH